MAHLKARLLAELAKIEGVEDRPSPVAGGSALFYFGKEFAHFHNANELDLRLTKTVIRQLGLTHPAGSVHHPKRAAGSAWIEVRFATADEIERVVGLVRLAVAQR
ncbi:hypothetical protein IGB42_03002 [Andreprevotia sp. IGB-42]|uniref:luciferase domain-containing protein n=1 Tax=Andreprevotia sp. IGB-42 TaxID=2497473 RepID=UPI0013595466|nr:luciferase family protein [Andreprevotia sp. IGB-42]KAF0812710.1 hypothetical protein IGB42_03002 [Andreprevotia sp. IGB-42]